MLLNNLQLKNKSIDLEHGLALWMGTSLGDRSSAQATDVAHFDVGANIHLVTVWQWTSAAEVAQTFRNQIW